MKSKKILVFFGHNANGDFLSYNGMIRFLLNYFDEIHIKLEDYESIHKIFLTDLYEDVLDRVRFSSTNFLLSYLNQNIQFIDIYGISPLGHKNDYNNIDNFLPHSSAILEKFINPSNFFTFDNKISKFLNTDELFTKNNLEFLDNASNFYDEIGLNPEIKYKNFYIKRNYELEYFLYKELLKLNNIFDGENYDVICDGHGRFGANWIQEKYKKGKHVNINYCTSNPLRLLTLFEKSKSIHLIENSHVLFIYYASMSGIVNLENVNIHLYARNRSEFIYGMFMNPKIENWNIIYE